MSKNDEILLEINRELNGNNQERLIAYAQGMLEAQGNVQQ